MSLRISSALLLSLAAAACSEASPPPPGEKVACVIGGAGDFSHACTLERVAGGDEFVIHHPDGGFRRFSRDPASGALSAGDGAEALVREEGAAGTLAFAVGADRYRVPAELLAAPARP